MNKTKYFLLMLFILSFIIKLTPILIFGFSAPTHDAAEYDIMAMNILEGKGFISSAYYRELIGKPYYPFTEIGQPTAVKMPLYPIFLAIIYLIFGHYYTVAIIIQLLMYSVGTLLVYAIGKDIYNKNVGIIASGIFSLYPHYIYYSSQLLTENLTTFLLLLSVFYLIRTNKRGSLLNLVLSGIFIGLTILCRSSWLLFPFGLFCWLFFLRIDIKEIIKRYLIILIISMAIVSPWFIRNYIVFNAFPVLQTTGGVNLYLGNQLSEMWGGELGAVTEDKLLPYLNDLNGKTEVEKDKYMFKIGKEHIKNSPTLFLKMLCVKFMEFFRVYSKNVSFNVNILNICSFGVILILSIFGVFLSLKYWRKSSLLLILIAYATFTQIFFTAAARYRIPIDVFISIYASQTLNSLRIRWKRRYI